MYILNSEVLSEDKIYWCNGIIANFLIYSKHIPLLTKKGRMFGFVQTKLLEDAIGELPFYMKVMKCF
jgi:hypothetical protein